MSFVLRGIHITQDTLTGSQEVSVAIGLLSCVGEAPAGTCDGIDTSLEIGTVLYAGPYTPQIRPGGDDLYQNFTVTVPEGFTTGPAALSVAHFFLDGVSSEVNARIEMFMNI